jgi:DNA-binding PadR family transcriptional regulator
VATEIRLTQPALQVLRFLLSKPSESHSGSEIAKETGILSGTLYPILIRMESARWLTSAWEQVEPCVAGRPRRRYYRFTPLGQNRACGALGDLQMPQGVSSWSS